MQKEKVKGCDWIKTLVHIVQRLGEWWVCVVSYQAWVLSKCQQSFQICVKFLWSFNISCLTLKNSNRLNSYCKSNSICRTVQNKYRIDQTQS